MEDDWDLHAVVRGCTTASSSITTTTTTAITTTFPADLHAGSCFSSSGFEQVDNLLCFPDPSEARNVIEELHELYKPFFPKLQSFSPQTTPFSSLKDQSHLKLQQQQQQPKESHVGTLTPTTTTKNSQTNRSKRRKNQLKKVCQVPAEGLSSDIWSWRKYGQKPIKGSPYPRGYYRCSSSKGCLARKQVERNRSDPGMFIVTYTAEHNHPAPTHRNSLAGTTRHKQPFAPQTVILGDSSKPLSSPATSMEDEVGTPSTKTERRADGEELMEDDEEGEFGLSDMVANDDFFEGLEGLAGPATGDLFSDHFPPSFAFPWLANNSTTAAGSG